MSALSGCRRLERCRTTRFLLRQLVSLVAHSLVCGASAIGMSLVGSEFYPGHPGLVLGVVLITAGAIDLGSDKGREWLFSIVSGLFQLMRVGAQATLEEWVKQKPRAKHEPAGDDDAT